jgi:hypothetical protein
MGISFCGGIILNLNLKKKNIALLSPGADKA